MRHETLLITGADVQNLVSLADCIEAVEEIFHMRGTGQAPEPGVLGVHSGNGGFHIKAALATLSRPYFVAKTNGNFPENPRRNGLPSIQGVLVLCDATDGRPLALMDSMEITTLRTAAATGVAARHLSRAESTVATIVGCGVQGRAQLRAVAAVRPLERAHAVDTDPASRTRFARDMTEMLGIPVTSEDGLAAAGDTDIWVTCTTSRRPVLGPEHVRPGAFVAAVGADNPEKQEIDPRLFEGTTVVVDIAEQCAAIGDLRHALEAGSIRLDQVHAELGEVVAGSRPGRSHPSEVVLFDSTGTALQDLAAAAIVYERAVERGHPSTVVLGS